MELKQGYSSIREEVTYLKLREKKIMYLVHLLQSKGYPVTQVFESSVKPISTLRFEEFLRAKELEEKREQEADEQV